MATQADLRAWIQKHRFWTVAGVVLVLLLVFILYLFLKPFSVENMDLQPDPAADYEEAIARIGEVQEAENSRADINALCLTRLWTHGQKTEKAIVFLHGFTSCPEQFAELGEEFFQRGYNVYLPRTPHHGLKDLMTEDLVELTAEEGVQFASQSADIAQGLGEIVTVSGLSGGGTYTTWLAQQREDVEISAPIAPFVGVSFIPAVLNRPLTNLALMLPNFFIWWDPRLKSANPYSASYAYSRYPTHALADLLRLGFATEGVAHQVPPKSPDIVVITNANDDSVNNTIVAEFVEAWQTHGADLIETYQFAKDLGLPHDLITPTRPGGNIGLVYPILHELLETEQ